MSKENRLFGRNGGIVVTDKNVHTGTWYKIVVIKPVKFESITITAANGTAFEGSIGNNVEFQANHILYGKITSIKLTSGACIAYNDED